MTTPAAPRFAPQPLLSAPLHLAVVLAVAAGVGGIWHTAGQASQERVQTVTQSMNRTHIALPSVVVVGKREPTVKPARPAV
jgi:hypothetical protein